MDLDYIAKVAIYSRELGYMKDMPALLIAFLASNGYRKDHAGGMDWLFHRVLDNGRMLRNFVQIIRSGRLGDLVPLMNAASSSRRIASASRLLRSLTLPSVLLGRFLPAFQRQTQLR